MSSNSMIAGIDEAGRGPLAGPVVAAAVILSDIPIAGVGDSKQISALQRDKVAQLICKQAIAWAVAWVKPKDIDRLNILQATLLAMQKAVTRLVQQPTKALIDGNCCPQLSMPAEAIIKGDSKIACIGAASILAKVVRDRFMAIFLDKKYPQYGFAQHKGYPTALHKLALQQHGPCAAHRFSYKPVQDACKT